MPVRPGVSTSRKVKAAELEVQKIDVEVRNLENELAQLRTQRPKTVLSGLRQFVFGSDDADRKIVSIERQIKSHKLKLDAALMDLRIATNRAYEDGASEYGADWAERNPDKRRF